MVEHVVIADADRHEVKHVSTAVANQYLKCITPGTSGFSFISYNELINKPTVTGFQSVLVGQSAAAVQQPAAVNTPLQVEFGPLQTTANATLSATGLLTFNTAGQYAITLFMRFGRTSGAGDAYLFNRLMVNGSQFLNSNALRLSSQDIITPFSATVTLNASVGTTFAVEIMRDGAGINNGGLFQVVPSIGGWANAPTATIAVSKFIGLT